MVKEATVAVQNKERFVSFLFYFFCSRRSSLVAITIEIEIMYANWRKQWENWDRDKQQQQ